MDVAEKLEALRRFMHQKGLDAFVVNGSDPHASEYPPDRYRTREWISGFTGSAGTVIVTRDRAGLFTDGRYHLSAAEELAGTPIELFREGSQAVPSPENWLASQLAEGPGEGIRRVGVDGASFSTGQFRTYAAALPSAAELVPSTDPFDEIWPDRPTLPRNPIETVPEEITGSSAADRLERVRRELARSDTDWTLIASLDDIAWTLNLRGSDVAFNPVFVAFLLVGPAEAALFVDETKLTGPARASLKEAGVSTEAYDSVWELAPQRAGRGRIFLSPERVPVSLFNRFQSPGADGTGGVTEGIDVSTYLKARKNDTELEGIRRAMLKDGRAMVRFLAWLSESVRKSQRADRPTEVSAASKLAELRGAEEDFVGPSFETISAWGPNGAMVHYAPGRGEDVRLEEGTLYLLDSGGQYRHGTTDITRTLALGTPSEQARRDYTRVLQGHIALATTRFPVGTTGTHLDAIARRPLWAESANYGHGTGHGIGFYLSVHEGPQRISPKPSSVALEPGMICSNEPGLYRTGEYGIRIENLVAVVEHAAGPFGRFLAFETLTLCPLERELIATEMLSAEERRWVDEYHIWVRESLTPLLAENERSWLSERTAPL
jgi:Xaa-Pro aminopeptidase